MSLMSTARKHDLPPMWDGRIVTWHGWQTLPPAFLCPPPAPDCCRSCGSMTPSVTNRGSRKVVERGSRWMPSLIAFRCPDCRADKVWDTGADEWWDLDASDYGNDGSVAL